MNSEKNLNLHKPSFDCVNRFLEQLVYVYLQNGICLVGVLKNVCEIGLQLPNEDGKLQFVNFGAISTILVKNVPNINKYVDENELNNNHMIYNEFIGKLVYIFLIHKKTKLSGVVVSVDKMALTLVSGENSENKTASEIIKNKDTTQVQLVFFHSISTIIEQI